jgi:hypothetical protein
MEYGSQAGDYENSMNDLTEVDEGQEPIEATA